MGLFDKKFCDICGVKIGLLGNRKLEDGNLCKDCAKKLSPFFSDRRRSTVEDIRQQLESRAQNKELLKSFSPTQVFGGHTKVYIDRNMGKFCVSRRSDFREENADLIDLAAVTGARYDVEEERNEIYAKDAEGNEVSYNPPQYEYSYQITLYIDVNHPYINEISFEVTDLRPDSRYSEAFRQYERTANEIVAALRGMPVAPGTDGAGVPYGSNPQAFPGGYGVAGAAFAPDLNAPTAPYGYNPDAVLQGPQPQGTIFPNGYQPGYPQQDGSQPQVQQPYAPQPGVWFCPNCGRRNDGRFCPDCGTVKPN